MSPRGPRTSQSRTRVGPYRVQRAEDGFVLSAHPWGCALVLYAVGLGGGAGMIFWLAATVSVYALIVAIIGFFVLLAGLRTRVAVHPAGTECQIRVCGVAVYRVELGTHPYVADVEWRKEAPSQVEKWHRTWCKLTVRSRRSDARADDQSFDVLGWEARRAPWTAATESVMTEMRSAIARLHGPQPACAATTAADDDGDAPLAE